MNNCKIPYDLGIIFVLNRVRGAIGFGTNFGFWRIGFGWRIWSRFGATFGTFWSKFRSIFLSFFYIFLFIIFLFLTNNFPFFFLFEEQKKIIILARRRKSFFSIKISIKFLKMDSKQENESFSRKIPEGFEIPSRILHFEWKFFFRSLQSDRYRRYKAKCMFCEREFDGRTERLAQHFLNNECPSIPIDILNQYKSDFLENSRLKNKKEKEKNEPITEQPEFNNDIFNEMVLKFVLNANLPFRVVDDPFFKRLINYTSANRSDCHLLSSTSMRYQLLNNFATKIRSNNVEQLSTNTDITIAMDGWTDVNGQSIYAITAISSSNQYLLSIYDLSSIQHNAQNLKQHLTSIIFQNNKIDPSSIIALVTDTPKVMEKMKSDIQNEYKNIISLKCALHVLNLICKDITQLDTSKEIIQDNSTIINYFKSSHIMLSLIKKYQKDRNISNTLQSYTPTRWFSLSKLCQSVQTYKDAFQQAAHKLPINNKQVSEIINDEIHFLKNKYLLEVIKPIADNIGYLEKDSATLGDVFFSIIDIYIKIESLLIPRTYNSLQIGALKSVFKRFLSFYENPIYIVAFFLWPKFKRVVISEKKKLSDIIKNVITLSMSWELFDIDEAKLLFVQLNQYAESAGQFYLTDSEANLPPREYWKNYPFKNHPIYRFANKIFSICPHSASVERVFSRLGLTKTKLRNRMSTPTLFKIAIARNELRNEIECEPQVDSRKEILSENQHKDDSEDESESEASIFFEEFEQIDLKLIENENKNENKNYGVNLCDFTNNSEEPSQGLEELLPDNNPNQSIYHYLDLNAFKEIISTNNGKTRSSTNLDSLTPPTKKIRNNFCVEDIVPDIF